jgi:hypothetical protein
VIVCYPSGRNSEKAKEVVGTVDLVHQLSFHVLGVIGDLQSATVFALRDLLFVANFNNLVHFLVAAACIYKTRAANAFSLDSLFREERG